MDTSAIFATSFICPMIIFLILIGVWAKATQSDYEDILTELKRKIDEHKTETAAPTEKKAPAAPTQEGSFARRLVPQEGSLAHAVFAQAQAPQEARLVPQEGSLAHAVFAQAQAPQEARLVPHYEESGRFMTAPLRQNPGQNPGPSASKNPATGTTDDPAALYSAVNKPRKPQEGSQLAGRPSSELGDDLEVHDNTIYEEGTFAQAQARDDDYSLAGPYSRQQDDDDNDDLEVHDNTNYEEGTFAQEANVAEQGNEDYEDYEVPEARNAPQEAKEANVAEQGNEDYQNYEVPEPVRLPVRLPAEDEDIYQNTRLGYY